MSQVQDIEETLANLNEDNASEICEVIENSNIEPRQKEMLIARIKREEFQGPIPPPHILQQYGEIKSEYADTIIEMALNEQKHRHAMESMIVSSEVGINSERVNTIKASVKMKMRLQIFGFFITTIMLLAGVAFIYMDKNIGSITAFVLAIGSFCWTMFYGKKNPESDKNEAAENEEVDEGETEIQ